MARDVFVNAIGTAVPPYDVHRKFVAAAPSLLADPRHQSLFRRMAERCWIEHRYSCLAPHPDAQGLDRDGFYRREGFPDTARRMARYEREAPPLALRAIADLGLRPGEARVSHLIVASCTGFAAPGLDLQIAEALGLPGTVERTLVGFMGCYAAIPALKLARHIVRSDPDARVLVVAIELCTLHLQLSGTLDELLSFMIFADGCAAALVTAEPRGLELQGFATAILPDSRDHITWHIGNSGFDMHLSGRVPIAIQTHLPDRLAGLIPGCTRRDIALWAVHPGGRTVLEAVERGAGLAPEALAWSRRVLRDYGNMSSATVMFVLRDMIERRAAGLGCALAFGPGIAVEAMRFAA